MSEFKILREKSMINYHTQKLLRLFGNYSFISRSIAAFLSVLEPHYGRNFEIQSKNYRPLNSKYRTSAIVN